MFEQGWVRESVLGRMRAKECVQGVSLSVCVWVCVGEWVGASVQMHRECLFWSSSIHLCLFVPMIVSGEYECVFATSYKLKDAQKNLVGKKKEKFATNTGDGNIEKAHEG